MYHFFWMIEGHNACGGPFMDFDDARAAARVIRKEYKGRGVRVVQTVSIEPPIGVVPIKTAGQRAVDLLMRRNAATIAKPSRSRKAI